MTRVTFYLVNCESKIVGFQDQVILNITYKYIFYLLLPITNLEFTHNRSTVSVCLKSRVSNDRVLTVSRQNRVHKRTFPRFAKLLARARFTIRNITRSMSNTMIARAPGSNSLDPTKVEARSDTREIPLATIDERHPSTNYAGSQDTSSENANIYTRRSPVPPQANHLVLERTQRAREATTMLHHPVPRILFQITPI